MLVKNVRVLQKMCADPVALVDAAGPAITTHQLGPMLGGGRGHERVVGGSAHDPSVG